MTDDNARFPEPVPDDEFRDLLPKALMDRAFTTSAASGSAECAWLRDDALAVIKLLRGHGFVILGVDVWIARPDIGPNALTPICRDWDPDAWMRSPRFPRLSTDFIRAFELDADESLKAPCDPYFNLTVAKGDGLNTTGEAG